MIVRNLTTTAFVVTLVAAPMLPALSQEAPIQGQIEHTFDDRILVRTDDKSILVELPDSVSADTLQRGQRVIVEGERSGQDMVAGQVRLQSGDEAGGDNDAAEPAGSMSDLPDELAGLDLQQVRTDRDDDEVKYRGRLGGDAPFEAEYHRDGRLKEVEVESGATLPESLVNELLSEIMRGELTRLGFARLHEIEIEEDEIEIKGRDTSQQKLEAEFSPEGLLLEFKRKGDRDRSSGRPMQIDRGTLREIAEDAGYSDIGRIKIHGRHADVDATNPGGERVRIRIDTEGEITREQRR